eukprot:g1152.t1
MAVNGTLSASPERWRSSRLEAPRAYTLLSPIQSRALHRRRTSIIKNNPDSPGPASGEPDWTCGICGRVNVAIDLRCVVCQRIHGKTLDWTKLQSRTPLAHACRAAAYREGGFHRDELREIDLWRKKDPSNIAVDAWRSIAQARLGRYHTAAADGTALLARATEEKRPAWSRLALDLRASALFQGKEYQDCLKDLNQRISSDPSNARAYYWRSRAHEELGNIRDSEADVNRWLAREAYDFKVTVLQIMGRDREAVKTAREWMRAEPKNPRTFSALVTLLQRQGKHKECHHYFSKWLHCCKSDAQRCEVHEVHLRSLRALELYEEGVKVTKHWLKMLRKSDTPDVSVMALVLTARAEAHVALHKMQEAIEDYGEILVLTEPDDTGRADDLGKLRESIQPVNDVKRISQRTKALSHRVILLLQEHRVDEAVEDCQEWLDLDPGNKLAEEYLQRCFAEQKKARKKGGRGGGKKSAKKSQSKHKSKAKKKGGSGKKS